MKTVVGMFWGVMVGLFLACGVIVLTQLLDAGSDVLGFTEWTFRYYMLCLGVCIALLVGSKPVRQYWQFMGFFFVAVVMVIAVGFQTFGAEPSFQGNAAQMQVNMTELVNLAAKAWMYVTPGLLTAFYGVIAFDGVSTATARKPLK